MRDTISASHVTCYCFTSAGQSHIFTGDITDSTIGADGFTAITDLITSQGLASLQGQTIVRVMAWTENVIGQGAGIVIVDPQNTPVASIPVAALEKVPPNWESVSIGPVSLNWVMKVQTQAS